VTSRSHLAFAVGSTGSTGSTKPAYRVDIHVGSHDLVADESAASGGGDVGPSPLGLVISALVACTALTLRMYATNKGWDLPNVRVEGRFVTGDDGCATIERVGHPARRYPW
jgi:putative redox protein